MRIHRLYDLLTMRSIAAMVVLVPGLLAACSGDAARPRENTPPVATIHLPEPAATFAAGDAVAFAGSGAALGVHLWAGFGVTTRSPRSRESRPPGRGCQPSRSLLSLRAPFYLQLACPALRATTPDSIDCVLPAHGFVSDLMHMESSV
jgi:hypothetical protein